MEKNGMEKGNEEKTENQSKSNANKHLIVTSVFRRRSFITPHMQCEQGKVIGVGVLI